MTVTKAGLPRTAQIHALRNNIRTSGKAGWGGVGGHCLSKRVTWCRDSQQRRSTQTLPPATPVNG